MLIFGAIMMLTPLLPTFRHFRLALMHAAPLPRVCQASEYCSFDSTQCHAAYSIQAHHVHAIRSPKSVAGTAPRSGPNLAAVNALFALSNCFNSDDVMSDLIRAE